MRDLAASLAATSGDPRPWAQGTVLSVDQDDARLTVDLDGAPVVLRRVAGRYRAGDVVSVVRDPAGTGAGLFVAGVLSAGAPSWRTAVIDSIDTGAKTITATFPDGTAATMPHLTATYTVADVVLVLDDPVRGPVVMGVMPSTVTTPDDPETPSTPTGSGSVAFTATILPTVTSTWRTVRSAWGRWDTTWSLPGDVYQNGSPASGNLDGLACYGNRVLDLGADTITRVTLTLISNGAGLSSSDWTATVQGCADGALPAGAPTFTGDTATVAVGGYGRQGRVSTLELGSTVREALRTGAVKSLGLSGAAYGGTYGTGKIGAWALGIEGTKAT